MKFLVQELKKACINIVTARQIHEDTAWFLTLSTSKFLEWPATKTFSNVAQTLNATLRKDIVA